MASLSASEDMGLMKARAHFHMRTVSTPGTCDKLGFCCCAGTRGLRTGRSAAEEVSVQEMKDYQTGQILRSQEYMSGGRIYKQLVLAVG